jgi:hypothetical protein
MSETSPCGLPLPPTLIDCAAAREAARDARRARHLKRIEEIFEDVIAALEIDTGRAVYRRLNDGSPSCAVTAVNRHDGTLVLRAWLYACDLYRAERRKAREACGSREEREGAAAVHSKDEGAALPDNRSDEDVDRVILEEDDDYAGIDWATTRH